MLNTTRFRQAWLAALLIAAVSIEASAPTIPVAAQSGPTQKSEPRLVSEPSTWNTHPVKTAAAPAQQPAASCEQATLNPTLDYDGLYWNNFLVGDVLLSTATETNELPYYSYPTSFRMVEDNDGASSTDPPFDDAFGQFFYVPLNTQRIIVDLNVAQAQASAGDTLSYEIYAYDYNALIGGDILDGPALKSFDVPAPADNQWFSVPQTITDASVLERIRGKFAVLVVGTRVDDQAPSFDIYVDDVSASTCSAIDNTSGGTINGRITQRGEVPRGISSAQMLLVRHNPTGEAETIATTTPDANGNYSFAGVPELTGGAVYQVWYQNDGLDTDRLAFYAGPLVTTFGNGGQHSLQAFDIGNVVLNTPTDATRVKFPASFSWQARPGGVGIADSGYRFCLYDLSTYAQVCSTDVLAGTSFTLQADDLLNNSDLGSFSFSYDRPYGWYIQAIGASYDQQRFADVGYSYANQVTFVEGELPPAPVENARLNLNNTGGGPTKKWTVMVYMAGDNDLSSPVFAGNLREQYDTLKRIAVSYKDTLNLVTLADFDEDGDTQFCVLTDMPETPCATPTDPAEREKNTADPLVLTNFISTTVSTFQTDHYMLIISGHAQMVNGIAIDETSEGAPSMTPAQLRKALTDGTTPLRARGKKLDILYYYACLMGGLEAAYDAAANADYMIASSDQAWIVDIYEQLLGRIKANLDDPAAIATAIVGDYRQKVAATMPPGLFTSVAAYKLSNADAVRTALSELADALRADSAAADAVRELVQVYDSSGDDNNSEPLKDAFVDLRDLARLLSAPESSSSTDVKARAGDLLRLLVEPTTAQSGDKLVIASEQVSGLACTARRNFSNASGLMVYFPSKNIYLPAELDEYRRSFSPTFNSGSSWDEFIIGYINKTPARAPGRSRRGSLPVGGGVPSSCGDVWLPLVLRK